MFRRRRFLAGVEAHGARWFTPSGTIDAPATMGDPAPAASPSTSTARTRPTAPPTARLLLDDDFLVLVNAWWEPLEFVLPADLRGSAMGGGIDTYDPSATAAHGKRPRVTG